MSSTGILGGSFNPPHVGHLVCARSAAEQLGLDRVLLVPLSEPSHRELEGDPGPQARLGLCRLAVGDDPVLEASAIEVDRGGVSYTVQTLEQLTAGSAGGLTLILGADAAEGLEGWKDPDRVVELATLAIAPRPGGGGAEMVAAGVVDRFPGARVETFPMPEIGISSSLVRERVAAGLSIRDLVPRAVEDEITASGWYGAGGDR